MCYRYDGLEVEADRDVVVLGFDLVVATLLEGGDVWLEVVAYEEVAEVHAYAEVEANLEDFGVAVLLFEEVGLDVVTFVGAPLAAGDEVEFEVRTEEGDDLDLGGVGEGELVGCLNGDSDVGVGELALAAGVALAVVCPGDASAEVEEEGDAVGEAYAVHDGDGGTFRADAIGFVVAAFILDFLSIE